MPNSKKYENLSESEKTEEYNRLSKQLKKVDNETHEVIKKYTSNKKNRTKAIELFVEMFKNYDIEEETITDLVDIINGDHKVVDDFTYNFISYIVRSLKIPLKQKRTKKLNADPKTPNKYLKISNILSKTFRESEELDKMFSDNDNIESSEKTKNLISLIITLTNNALGATFTDNKVINNTYFKNHTLKLQKVFAVIKQKQNEVVAKNQRTHYLLAKNISILVGFVYNLFSKDEQNVLAAACDTINGEKPKTKNENTDKKPKPKTTKKSQNKKSESKTKDEKQLENLLNKIKKNKKSNDSTQIENTKKTVANLGTSQPASEAEQSDNVNNSDSD